MKVDVSIVVPVYNGALYIERCIDSIRKQTYKNIEIIIVDDGSEDASFDLCEKQRKLDERISLIRQENKGVVSARKKGVSNARGEYVLFVDADDWIEANMVEELLLQIGEADIISSGAFVEKFPGWVTIRHDSYEAGCYETEREKQLFYEKMIYDLEEKSLHPLLPWMFNKLFKRDKVEKLFKQMDDTVFYAEDAIFVYSYVLKAGSIVITHQPYYHYCYNENSVCHKEHKNMLANINEVYLDMCHILGDIHADKVLYQQLQVWITFLVKDALNEKLGFYESGCIPDFLLDARQLGGAQRFVLYGAGRMGEDFANQLKKLGCEVVLWVDGNYQYWQKKGKKISDPLMIKNCVFDKIIVAVSSEKARIEIKDYLVQMDVKEEKIILPRTIAF